MGYINPPEPADKVVMVEATEESPAFTWGDHRKMLKFLDELEEDNPMLAASRQRLDDMLATVQIDRICSFCRRPESTQLHDPECPDNRDPALWVKREAAGYQYLSDKFVPIHTTSVPMTDEEALGYFSIVQLMFPADPDLWVRYITRKPIDGLDYKMMPFQYNKDVGEVFPL